MTVQEAIRKVDSMDQWQKLRVYIHYRSVQICMKYSCLYVFNKEELKGWGKPDHTFKGLHYFYLWSGNHILSFDDFLDGIKVYDHGVDWENKRFAQRYDTRYSGIYNWYMKFAYCIE